MGGERANFSLPIFNAIMIKGVNNESYGAYSVYAADLDGDGDLDVLSASWGDDKIAWYQNDGSGNFGPQSIISTDGSGVRSVYAADLDGDGDIDVISASFLDNKIAWYENLIYTLGINSPI